MRKERRKKTKRTRGKKTRWEEDGQEMKEEGETK